MTEIVFCEACDERYHARRWVLEGANSWWLVEQHALGRHFKCESDAFRYAKKHDLEIVFRGVNGPATKTLEQLAYEEALDLVAYLRQAIYERDSK